VRDNQRTASTGQINWQLPRDGQDSGRFLVDAPRVRCAVGSVQGKTIDLHDVSVTVTQASNGWASLGLAALDGQPIDQSKRMLLVAVGRVGNTGMQWNENRTSIADNWGSEPTIAEGIGGTVRLPGTVTVCALTSRGEESTDVPVQKENGNSLIEIGPQFRTLWYLITRD
jgi:hypothetical protein